jgi:chromosome segregation ATPase
METTTVTKRGIRELRRKLGNCRECLRALERDLKQAEEQEELFEAQTELCNDLVDVIGEFIEEGRYTEAQAKPTLTQIEKMVCDYEDDRFTAEADVADCNTHIEDVEERIDTLKDEIKIAEKELAERERAKAKKTSKPRNGSRKEVARKPRK